MMLATIIMAFAIIFGSVEQHRSLLQGQAMVLLVNQIMLASSQGDMMIRGHVHSAALASFFSILLSVIGCL